MVNNQKICGLIGLATKAGKIVAGTDACLQEIDKRNVYIKVKIRSKKNHKIFCVSFHFARYSINKLPYAN